MSSSPLSASYDYCRRLTQRAAQNFHFAFLALPRPKYEAMCALYAFMRITDDLGDDYREPVTARRLALHKWRTDVQAALNGEAARHPALAAFADTVSRHAIPWTYLEAVLTGVERDLDPVRIANFAELSDYCYHVAGAVGVCCIHIWGFTDEEAIPMAIDCGFALQLTNILRDLAEDWSLGRVYLPQEDFDRFGYTLDDLSHQTRDERFTNLMRFEADRARSSYRRAERLFVWLEPSGRPILRAMLEIYGGLLEEIERRRYDVFSQRVSLPQWKKLWIAGRAMWAARSI
ncbi:MAG: terpene synthase [Planctomycetales bacterium 12-60-4]|nr:MAG: terpene synthase [Planctomycetales bacterium 12-60-4]